MSSARRLWPGGLLALALGLAACGDKEGPAGPGGRNGVLLHYVSPRLQVVPSETPARVVVALEVQRETPSGTQPWADAELRVVRTKGRGTPTAERITTDGAGLARVEIAMPAASDKTALVVSLVSDSDSYLPFDVVSAPVLPVDLAPGQVAHLDPPRDGVLLRFAADASYALIPYQTDLERGGTPYRFFHQPPSVAGIGAAAFGADAIAEPYRAAPPGSADFGHDVVSGEIDHGRLVPAAAVPPNVSIKSCRISANRQAPLRYLGRRIAIYVDTDPNLYQARIDSLGVAFDERIEPTNTRYFGPMTDLDANGVVLVVFSPDLQGGGGAYCDSVRFLRIEAFYVLWNPTAPIETLLSLMAHEHQHVINAGLRLHVMNEALWLNEGMSFAAEALNTMWYSVLPRAWRFLNGQNGGLTMLPIDYNTQFDASYMMFLLYLGDRFGPDFYIRLGTGRLTGISNLEKATGLPFATLLRDWFTAVAVAGSEAAQDPAYAYRSLSLPGMEGEIAGCQCVPVQRLTGMWLEPLHMGTGFDAFRTLDRADADYYELVAPSGLGVSSRDVYYDAYGRAAVKLTVARLR